jgi:hypothetical protein
MQMLGVDYVLVVFGGVVGYQSDDLQKFPWMVRIAGGVFDGAKDIAGMSEYICIYIYI